MTTKTCAKCKIIFPNNRNYFLFSKKGKAIPYCKKCKRLIAKNE